MELPTNALYFEHLNWHGRMPGMEIFIDPAKFDKVKPLVEKLFDRYDTSYFFQCMEPESGYMMVEFWGPEGNSPKTVNAAINLANELGIDFVETECREPLLPSPPHNLKWFDKLEMLFDDGTLWFLMRTTCGVGYYMHKATLLKGMAPRDDPETVDTFVEDIYGVANALADLRTNHGRIVAWNLEEH